MSATCVSKFRSFWSFPTKQHRGSFYGTPCITDSQKLPKLNIHTEYCALSWYFRCVVPNHWKIHSCSDSQYAINSNAARPITGSEQWSNANDVSLLHVIYLVYSRQLKRAFRRPFLTIFGKCEPQNIVGHFVDPKRHILRVWLKTDGTTGQRRDRTEHPSCSWWPYRRPDDKTGRTTGQQLLPIDESVVIGTTGQTKIPVYTVWSFSAHLGYIMSMQYFCSIFLKGAC